MQEPGVLASDIRLRGQALGAAATPAPKAQTGQLAFERAAESSRMAKTSSLAEANKDEEDKLAGLGAANNEVRRAGGRLFAQRSGVWTDAGLTDSLPVVEVAPYSAAYFALVRVLPELAPCLSLGDEILVGGRTLSLRFTGKGTDSMSEQELTRVVKGFRGA